LGPRSTFLRWARLCVSWTTVRLLRQVAWWDSANFKV